MSEKRDVYKQQNKLLKNESNNSGDCSIRIYYKSSLEQKI